MTANLNSSRDQSAARITRQNLSAMKANADLKPSPVAFLKKLADATASESVGFMAGLAKAVTYKPNACKNNGHVLHAVVFNVKPRCVECGLEVSSVQELRAGVIPMASANEGQSIEYWVDPTLKQRRMGLIPTR